MDEIEQLRKEIADLKTRNLRVDAEKAWETSGSRKICIALLTYAVIVLFFISIQSERPFVNALVPTAGFLLSTLSLPLAKRLWFIWKKK